MSGVTISPPTSSLKKSIEVTTEEIIPLEEVKSDIDPYTSYSPPTSIINFRDVSSIVNGVLKSEWITPGKIYRSARPDEATLADREILKSTFGIRTIIDLRTTTEHSQQKEKYEARLRNASELANSSSSITGEDLTRPLRIPEIDYVDINLNGSAYSRFMLAQLDWVSFFRLLFLMALGRRLEAISIMATTVMVPRGLAGLAIDSLDVCQAEVKSCFEILGDETRYPVLVHCTQGKDRTGLVVQLVLMLLTTPTNAVQADYMRTSKELLGSERSEKLLEIHSIGLTDEFADCDLRLVSIVDAHIREKYGGIEDYLEQCGVSLKLQQQVRTILAGGEQLFG